MFPAIADTHAMIWYFEDSPRLSAVAKQTIASAMQGRGPMYLSAVSLVEMTYLLEKGKIPRIMWDTLRAEMSKPLTSLVVAPLSTDAAMLVRAIPGSIVRDMPDRMIAATALSLGVPLVTCDRQIRASSVPTIW